MGWGGGSMALGGRGRLLGMAEVEWGDGGWRKARRDHSKCRTLHGERSAFPTSVFVDEYLFYFFKKRSLVSPLKKPVLCSFYYTSPCGAG